MLDSERSELIGAIIGDGNIWRKKYEIVITGDKEKDKRYFGFLENIIKQRFNYSPRIKYRQGALRLVMRSKKIYTFLIKFFPNGKKAKTVRIPENTNKISILRGIFDTDGTIFFAKKPGVEKYPTIEITTISRHLANDLVKTLKELNFRPTKRCFKENNPTFKIALNGKKQVTKWAKLIGSSNDTKLRKLKQV